jgi:Pyruvate/2-oxoacid:ferredoxin oxidoreductase delta subunit
MHTIIYFSPTGNVLHLVEMLASQLGIPEDKVRPLEFTRPGKLVKDDHLILLYSVHAFNAPRTVKRFVKRLPSGLYTDVSLIAVGCTTNWVNGAVSLDLRKLFAKKGYPILLDRILAMPLTFIMEFPAAVARKQIAESGAEIEGIARSLADREQTLVEPVFKSRLMNFIGKAEAGAARVFGLELHAGENCTSCGTCWQNCPERNIQRGRDGKPKFGFSCLMCMRCIYNCPQKAIAPRFSKFIPIGKGYSITQYLD